MTRLALSLLLAGCTTPDDTDPSDTDAELAPVAAEFVDAHNTWRDTVGVAHLSWDDTVAESAQGWADALVADSCAFEHENQYVYGENLWWATWDGTPTEVVDDWGSEVDDYDYDANDCAPGKMCGHYTQIVWSTTETVGCGQGVCSDDSVIWVCRYDPPGNWVGEKPY